MFDISGLLGKKVKFFPPEEKTLKLGVVVGGVTVDDVLYLLISCEDGIHTVPFSQKGKNSIVVVR